MPDQTATDFPAQAGAPEPDPQIVAAVIKKYNLRPVSFRAWRTYQSQAVALIIAGWRNENTSQLHASITETEEAILFECAGEQEIDAADIGVILAWATDDKKKFTPKPPSRSRTRDNSTAASAGAPAANYQSR